MCHTCGFAGGGELVTITGAGFGLHKTAIKVDFCGAACALQTISPSKITCKTTQLDTVHSFLEFDNIEQAVIKPTTRQTILAPEPVPTLATKYVLAKGKRCSSSSYYKKNCNQYTTVDDIEYACDSDSACLGFELKNGVPHCLVIDVTNLGDPPSWSSTTYDCYVKNAHASSSIKVAQRTNQDSCLTASTSLRLSQ